MKCEIDDIVMQIKPDKHFIDEYLTLKFGKKSQYEYFYDWYIVEDNNYFRNMHTKDFIEKYKGKIYVRLYRGPYTKTCIATGSVILIFTNDYRMKKLYQHGELGRSLWFYDDMLSDAEKQEYATGKKTLTWEWKDDIKGTEEVYKVYT